MCFVDDVVVVVSVAVSVLKFQFSVFGLTHWRVNTLKLELVAEQRRLW